MGVPMQTEMSWPEGDVTFGQLQKIINTAGRGIPKNAKVQLIGDPDTTASQSIRLSWDGDDWDQLRDAEESVRRR